MPHNRYGWMSILAIVIIALVVPAALSVKAIMAHKLGNEFGMEVSDTTKWVILLSDLLLTFWFIWIPAVFGACLIAAWLMPTK